MTTWEDSILNYLLKSYYEEIPQSKAVIDNYNSTMTSTLPTMFEEDGQLRIKVDETRDLIFSFNNVYLQKPMVYCKNLRKKRLLYPNECRIRNLSYTGDLIADIHQGYIEKNKTGIQEYKVHQKKTICKIPICLNSVKCNLNSLTKAERIQKGECKFDIGGYYIQNGKERVLTIQERMNYNSIYVFEKSSSKFLPQVAEIRSMNEQTRHSISMSIKILSKTNRIMISLPFFIQEVPSLYY